MGAEADELARFCAALPELRRLVRGPASTARRAVLEQAVLAARRGEPVAEFLARLDFVDDDALGPPRGSLPTPVPGPSRPVTGRYACPNGICGRIETRGAGHAVPRCDIHEQALTFLPDGSP
ncbi:hypothetical protein [Amycolatopsis alkalitolerans]|uniref:Uncharacterized protein n=1 Tax=Amycolatopsis alkalitolerans TaxID=2547244 RepID=A0A5C4M2L1_9PSEU|nr:hypothetical protein [Amycolatopsis alkalitolerans]TNC26420.1 hypothetical protein FG385_11730 [Amycolatopsis alkalitolerans]